MVRNQSVKKISKAISKFRYAECYPGSDDEADFSKMDLGNNKGPI